MVAHTIKCPVLPLQLDATSANGRSIVRCRGKLIAGSAELFKAEAVRLIDRSALLAVDLAGLTHLDGSGLRALLAVINAAQKAHCEFRLLNATPHAMELLCDTSLASG